MTHGWLSAILVRAKPPFSIGAKLKYVSAIITSECDISQQMSFHNRNDNDECDGSSKGLGIVAICLPGCVSSALSPMFKMPRSSTGLPQEKPFHDWFDENIHWFVVDKDTPVSDYGGGCSATSVSYTHLRAHET